MGDDSARQKRAALAELLEGAVVRYGVETVRATLEESAARAAFLRGLYNTPWDWLRVLDGRVMDLARRLSTFGEAGAGFGNDVALLIQRVANLEAKVEQFNVRIARFEESLDRIRAREPR